MEARVARLEASVEHIERDFGSVRQALERLQDCMDRGFRITWAGMIGTTLGLAGLMAKGFGWL